MAKLASTTVNGTITIDNYLLAGIGSGFQNVVVLTSGTSAVWTFPTVLQVPGAKFKLTIIGGGGAGGATGASPPGGRVGAGGGSGGLVIAYPTVISGLYSLVYTVGAGGTGGLVGSAGTAGTLSSVVYNSITYTAGPGSGGALATAYTAGGAGGTATNGVLNIPGNPGGASGTITAQQPVHGAGGNTPLGYGVSAGRYAAAGSAVGTGSGYGQGSGGAYVDITGYGGYAGDTAGPGVVIIEY